MPTVLLKTSFGLTSNFIALAISVLQQSLSTTAPTISAQFTHHLALLNHKSDTQRKESLSYLTTALSSTTQLPLPASAILPKVQPLILDVSGAVRTQVIAFIEALPPPTLRENIDQLILYVHAALTHLSVRIRTSGLDVLSVLLNVVGQDVVACPGGWVRTLKYLMALISWPFSGPSSSASAVGAKAPGAGWTTIGTSNLRNMERSDEHDRTRAKQISVLTQLVETGFAPAHPDIAARQILTVTSSWPVVHWYENQLPCSVNPYGYLRLFDDPNQPRDDEMARFEDRDERRDAWERYAERGVLLGVDRAKGEGGAVGRAVGKLEKVLREIEKGED